MSYGHRPRTGRDADKQIERTQHMPKDRQKFPHFPVNPKRMINILKINVN